MTNALFNSGRAPRTTTELMPKAERAIHDAKIQTSVNQYAAYKARAAKQLAKAEKERAARAERAAKAEAQAKKKAEAQATKAAQAEGRK